jgi:peptidyl-tRNA hydrolase, PTH1 family
MIKLIVGLGNPGQQYEKNRHNAGFLFLDRLVSEYGGIWLKDSKFHGLVCSVQINGDKVVLLKPTTFMNLSGQAVGAVIRYYKIQPDEILVVHDELDFAAGVVKLKKGGGHAGHNGLRDIIAHLDSKDFYRLRIGIGRPAPGKAVADYVLSNPGKAEMEAIETAFSFSQSCLPRLLGDVGAAMNELNKSV